MIVNAYVPIAAKLPNVNVASATTKLLADETLNVRCYMEIV